MEKLSMCRVCMGQDSRMLSLETTHLKLMYEAITMMPLETEDSRPLQACYICCARLQNCYQLRIKCLQSEELFTQILRKNMLNQVKPENVVGHMLKIEHPINLSIGDNDESSAGDDVRGDTPKKCIVKTERRLSEDNAAMEQNAGQVTTKGLTSEYFIPIDKIKKEIDDTTATKESIEDGGDNVSQMTYFEEQLSIEFVKVEDKKNETIVPVPEESISAVERCYEGLIASEVNTEPAHTTSKSTIASNPSCSKLKPYRCDICQISFSNKKYVYRHILTHGEVQKPYECDICKKRFFLEHLLNSHVRKHSGEKPYQCNVCLKSFRHKYHLKIHNRKHTGEKPFQCDVCKKCFAHKLRLSQHSRIHSDVKPYQCGVCNKSFSYNNRLNQHSRVHTGEKPYQCKVCLKCFIRKGDLSVHSRTHSVEKPYQCNLCDKGFKQKCHLTTHLLTHTGERPFQCEICKRFFSRKTNLTKHIKCHR